jgi:hypothetical protein
LITCFFNYDTGCFHYKLDRDCEYFDDIISLLKDTYHFFYHDKSKTWANKNVILVRNSLSDLKDYGKIKIEEDDKNLLEDLLYPEDSTYKQFKRNINKNWIDKHPPIIGKSPYENYQLDTIKFMLSRNRSIESLSPGTGKSYIAEGFLSSLKELVQNKKILWVCRLEGQYVTYLKILSFLSEFYNENDIAIVSTENREIQDYFNKKVIVTNYTSMRLSNEYYHQLKRKSAKGHKPSKCYIDFSKWGKPEDLVLILDEGQAIKNFKGTGQKSTSTLQSETFFFMKDYFDHRHVLSGSLGYNILDYYSICKILIPESIPYSYSEFRDYLTVKGTYGKRIIPHRVKEFKEKVIDKIQISYDENVLDLPPFEEKEIFIPMTKKMKEMYQSFIGLQINKLRDKKEKELSGKQLETSFMTLSQFTSDPLLIKDQLKDSWSIEENPKIEILKSMLNQFIDEEKRKVVLWSNHPKVINELAKLLKKYKPIVIHGDEKTSVERGKRDSFITEFRTKEENRLLICSYVLNSSIDLYEATREIYFDNILNNDARNQSKKRIWRLGQKEKVESYYLLFDKSIDIYIYYEILQRKDRIRNLLLQKDELSIEDYRAIFEAKVEYYWKESV